MNALVLHDVGDIRFKPDWPDPRPLHPDGLRITGLIHLVDGLEKGFERLQTDRGEIEVLATARETWITWLVAPARQCGRVIDTWG